MNNSAIQRGLSVSVAFVLAVSITYICAVFFVSQLNISSIVTLGYEVGLAERLLTLLQDIAGMASAYLPLITVALAIAFIFTSTLLLRFIRGSGFLFALAGFVAIISIHLFLQLAFGLVAVAPTRTVFGLFSQGVSGALGGWVYFYFNRNAYRRAV